MPGLNTTGTANTNDYNLGRGIVYFAPLTNGLPGAYRDLGNAPEFNISVEVETQEHTSSRAGLRTVDKEVTISQQINLTLTIDELNFENLALFFAGDTEAAYTNPAETANTGGTVLAASVELGRWYDIVDDNNNRAYGFSATSNLAFDNSTDTQTLTEVTDYTVDKELGRVFIHSSATNIEAGEELTVTWAADNAIADVNEVKSLTSTAVSGALKFVSINPVNEDRKTEYQFHQVSLSAEGDFSLIGDDFTQMQLSGTAERNETADADSPTLTIRYPTGQ